MRGLLTLFGLGLAIFNLGFFLQGLGVFTLPINVDFESVYAAVGVDVVGNMVPLLLMLLGIGIMWVANKI